MVICSYVVIAHSGVAGALALRIAELPGCEVAPATNRDLLLVVTEAEDAHADAALRRKLEGLEGVRSLALTFGQVSGPDPFVAPATG